MTTVKLLDRYSTDNPDEAAVLAARGDYMERSLVSEEAREYALSSINGTDGEPKRERLRSFIEKAIQRGHWGIFEHPKAYFVVEGISRDQMAQITRHRVGVSFDVQSMRYVDFDDADFEIPETAEDVDVSYEGSVNAPDVDLSATGLMKSSYRKSLKRYKKLRESGMEKEDARKVLPIGTKVNMTFSINLRALLHVADLRVSGVAQHDTRSFMQQVMDEAREWSPITISEYEEHGKNSSLNSP
jgi:thymidylate synthase (FAD)